MATPKKINKKLAMSEATENANPIPPTTNLKTQPVGKLKDLNIKLTPDQHRAFKAHAAEKGISMHELFFEMWEYYKKMNP